MAQNYVKRIGLVKRREDLTQAQFEKHWLERHATLCLRLPGLKKYAVNLVSKDSAVPLGYDGFSELWFESEEALLGALSSQEGKELLADLPNFTSEIRPLVVIEHSMR